MSERLPPCACGHDSDLHNLELGRCYRCDVDCYFKAATPCATCGDEKHRHDDSLACIESLKERLARAAARIEELESGLSRA